jgi:ADP-heptose:LPS heptosyltransferase
MEFREAVESRGLPFRFLQALPDRDSVLHATDFYLRQVSGGEGAIPRLACAAGDGGYVAIHPFSGSAKKNWPFERYRQLAAALAQEMPALWIVDPGQPQIAGAASAPLFEDLYELASWIARARLYVGNDSGITHLAAAAGTRVLALYGPTDPAIWAPRGPNVRVIAPVFPGQPMTSITLEHVLAAAGSIVPG